MKFLTSKTTLTLSGILTGIFQLWIFFILRPLGSGTEVFRLQTTLSREEFKHFMIVWGPEKTEIFISHYPYDFIYPFIYSIFLAALLAQRLPTAFKNPRLLRVFILTPFLAGIFDEIENICQLSLIEKWQPLESILFEMGALASRAKWLLLAVSMGFTILALGLLVFRHVPICNKLRSQVNPTHKKSESEL